jgi:hypothetical protein
MSSQHDSREQLCNDRKMGNFVEVQLPLERITTLHGFLVDLDPKLYRPGNPIFPPHDDPRVFYDAVKPVLDRHPLARFAEVRATGTGLHVIVRLSPPAELTSASAQRHWDSMVRAVQHTLPGDTSAPGITALTRPVGAANSKNSATVALLRPGEPLNPAAVEQYLAGVARAPFRQVVTVLLGDEHVQPCPVCGAADSRLDVLDHVGICYKCGKVRLAQILDLVFTDRDLALPSSASRAAARGETSRRPKQEKKSRPAGPRARQRTSTVAAKPKARRPGKVQSD